MKTLLTLAALSVAALSVQAKDIVDTAVGAGTFKTLATALQAAGLVDTLKGKGPFTVFAPTDAAFAKVPKADLDALLKDKAKLTAVLTYHVVPGKVMAKDVKAGKVKTVQGSELTLGTTGNASLQAFAAVSLMRAAAWPCKTAPASPAWPHRTRRSSPRRPRPARRARCRGKGPRRR